METWEAVVAIGAEEQVRAALAAADMETARPEERAEMLMEIAVGLQIKPKSADELRAAVDLYDRALEICPPSHVLLAARIGARKATALQAIPEDGTTSLEQARDALQAAVPGMREHGTPEELAETEMNLGLVLQSLSGAGKARIVDAISAYQRALRTFDRAAYPKEYAILQNNLATAFLSIPFTDERAKMREALAVQAFEEGLRVVDLVDHPSEYAMLQNNLGNALQYASSSHSVENNLRAIEAYDEALKVRSRQSTPLEYANTIANKANCLWNLPDDVADPTSGNPMNLATARKLYAEAREIFSGAGELGKARIVAEALDQIARETLSSVPLNENKNPMLEAN
jgi:tetratricopeptide (TPR) repeat protein